MRLMICYDLKGESENSEKYAAFRKFMNDVIKDAIIYDQKSCKIINSKVSAEDVFASLKRFIEKDDKLIVAKLDDKESHFYPKK